MAGIFSKLFGYLSGRSTGTTGKTRQILSKIEEEKQHREQRQALKTETGAQTAAGFAALRAKIAQESAKILASVNQPIAAAIEQQRAEFLERTARAEQQRVLTPEEQFLAGKLVLRYGRDFQSTNPRQPAVYAVWYRPEEESLYVQFFDNSGGSPSPGDTYRYWILNLTEARGMYRYSSKGIAIWDKLRVRGSKTAHKKNYEKVAVGTGEPQWG